MSTIPTIDPKNSAIIQKFGGDITALSPLGARVKGIDLSCQEPPPGELIQALEVEMANRGFLVFQNEKQITEGDFLRVSCWWGGRELHSTHGVHPATPGGNRHIFRLSNDPVHGIPGVGPQWHNDGSFITDTFSHSGYHIIRPAENGGGTEFAHQGAAYDALSDQLQSFWSRLSSVNSSSGVVHPLVHEHTISRRKSIWLHLGMTGAVIEKLANEENFRLLEADELKKLCHQYNDILSHGLDNGYTIAFEYQENDCVFIDNLAVAHRASTAAHMPAEKQGLRIMHRSTVRGVKDFAPGFGLPLVLDINGPNPLGNGVWQSGGVGFRWDDGIPMQN
ncbi:taurine dioxygenase [Kineobactrum sediminis]|uniref:Taurine dioxygenase n=1 Tax=Kineobactrum sediminis TaxID=1905677 RepID=A0A2N5Y639_9GAMM|nr:TauD/TfdA family dioxygenase [Kineobactrum sediminis]PLW83858.1 taurine dioxygenase [Kineobactrum sediminis]